MVMEWGGVGGTDRTEIPSLPIPFFPGFWVATASAGPGVVPGPPAPPPPEPTLQGEGQAGIYLQAFLGGQALLRIAM